MKRLNLVAVAFLCFTTSSLTLFAQSDTDTVAHEELIPIEIKAIRVNDQSPFAVSNLNGDNIRQLYTGQDIPYILDHTPSVIVNSDGGTGVGYTDMRIRGTDNARINFTMNGIPLNDAESQGAFFVDFPDILGSANSIQVQRGVGSSTNGAGAFGASVNMSNTEQSKTAHAELLNSYGSFNTWHNMLRAGTGLLHSGFRFDVRLSRQTSDGYIDRSGANLQSLQFIAGWQSKDERTSLKFNLLTGKEKTGQAWNGVPEDSLQANRRYNELGLKPDGTYYNDQTDNYQQDYYQLFFNHQFNKYWSVNAALFLTRGLGYYNEYKMDKSFSDYGLPDFTTPAGDTFTTTNLVRQKWLDNYYYGAVYALQYQRNKTQFTLGGATTRYDGQHYGNITWADYGVPDDYQWYNDTANKSDINFYAKLQQQFARYFHFFADLQYRNVHYKINGFDDNPDIDVNKNYDFLNPKAGISFIKSGNGGSLHKAYASFAIANKEPNRDDYEASPIDLPKAEHLYDVELGYQYTHSKYELSADLYYMYYKDQLILTGKINEVGAYTRTNTPESYRTGVELQANIHPLEWLRFFANATLSQNKISTFTEYIDDYDDGGQQSIEHKHTDIALSPNAIAGAGASFNLLNGIGDRQSLWLDISGKYVGRQYLDNTSDKSRSIDAYTVFNAKLRYNVRTQWVHNLGIVLAVNNIFNKMYESKGYTYGYISAGQRVDANYYFPQAGTNWMLGLDFRW